MGKTGGFLEYRRRKPEYRQPAERVHDYRPVEQPPTESEIGTQASRCMDCGTPFCHAYGCPLGNLVPELNDMVYANRWQEALDLLLSTNPFPEFTSRVCPAPCEASCVLNINDESVTIRQIEMAIVEKGYETGTLRPRPPPVRLPQRLAVIGSGPAGLAVADAVNRAGYEVTVFDREPHAGGILRYGIPDFKLEKRVLDRRLKLMEEEGIAFELGVTVGEDVSYRYLRDRFTVICLAGGSREPRDLKVPGREWRGIHFAMTYLMRQNRILAGETVTDDGDDLNAEGKNVVIIGGGDTGADCLGTALRQGARRIVQMEILPRPPDSRPDSTPWPTWPNILRESSSHKEGGERRWAVNTTKFLGRDGRVIGLKGIEVEWVAGADGRMSCRDKPGTEFDLDAQLVLLAMGFVGPGPGRLWDDLGLRRDARGNLAVDERHMTSVPGIFAAGDQATGQSLVVRAIADGRAAARDVIKWLRAAGAGKVPKELPL